MSDRDLRRILSEIIEDFDTGRIRRIRGRLPGVRKVVGSAVIAAALGLGGAACDTRSVGAPTDAGTHQDVVVQVDAGGDLLYMAPMVDAGPMPEYAEPFFDAGIMPSYGEPFYEDAGMAPVDAGDAPAYMAPYWDASLDPEEDAGPQTAYGVPSVPPEDE